MKDTFRSYERKVLRKKARVPLSNVIIVPSFVDKFVHVTVVHIPPICAIDKLCKHLLVQSSDPKMHNNRSIVAHS